MTKPLPPLLQPGDVLLDKYKVERVLGQGGMGMVVAARHLSLGGLFAIKVLLPEMLENAEALERFLREARSAARLNSEHITRVHDAGSMANGAPFMVLEYLEGTDLDQEVTARGMLGVGEAAAYVMQVCEALVEAHGQGIVHRDLKPANLFLTRRSNGSACIKVLDFGISKDLTSIDKTGAKLTKTGMIVGSPHYMSPEQLIDSKSVDPRSDLWSLGVILYELVTGQMPFDADSMPKIVAKVLTAQPQPPSQVRPGISTEFDALIARCIQKERENRFQSVEEFMNALAPFANEYEAPGRISGRAPFKSSAAVTLTQSASNWGQETLPLQTKATEQAASSSRRNIVLAGALAIVTGFGLAAFVISRSKNEKAPEKEITTSASNIEVAVKPMNAPPDEAQSAALATSAPANSAPTQASAPAIVRPTATISATAKTKKKVKGFDE